LTTLDACHILTSSMAISFKYRGASFTADTPQEAAETLAILKRSEAEEKIRKLELKAFMDRKISQFSGYRKQFETQLNAYDEGKFTWTSDRFLALMSHLGKPQKAVLALLVTKRSVTDAELRAMLNVPGNQALAGILSGISKQALALNIPPRAIFDLENFRVGGKRRSDYLITEEFRKIAGELEWPAPNPPRHTHSEKFNNG
jgi:hypothetical protein